MTSPNELPDDHLSTLRLASLGAATSAVVWCTSPDGHVVAENASWGAFTGQARAAYSGLGWLDAVHPDDRKRVAQGWQIGVASAGRVEFEYRLRRHDGAYRHVLAQGAPVYDGDAVREWIGLCIDITDRRQAEAALRESEERLKLLDALGEATRSLTDAAEVMAVTARLLGEHLHATRCAYADVDHDNDRFTIRSDWSAPGVASTAGVYSLDLFGPRATSSLRNGRKLVVCDVDTELGDEGGARMFNAIGIKAIITAPLVKDGRLVAMMAVHQATPRQWTARDIAIVGEVVERCWAHIERVRDAAMLREQDRRKDEFLATLAHELRNPVAPIRYAVALMKRTSDPEQLARARDIVDRQGGHLARLIDDLLDLSRINRGLIELRRERVALASLIEQAVETARPAIEAARHEVQLALPEASVAIEADPARIVQVIANLLNNAAKYTPDGGRIRVAAWAAGRSALVEVCDNGVGIPPGQQGRLFQMFTQLHHTAGRSQGGLGIGLLLVKNLVRLHGGDVRVYSAGLDEGTTFTLTLPLAEGRPAPNPQELPAELASSAQSGVLRVLVVEDNPDGLASLVELLQIMGYDTRGAQDGPSGLDQARGFRPHVVLLDLGLPGMDGITVARHLRADPLLAKVHLVALTGWGADADRLRTAQAGFDEHLTKPVAPAALESYLARISVALLAADPL